MSTQHIQYRRLPSAVLASQNGHPGIEKDMDIVELTPMVKLQQFESLHGVAMPRLNSTHYPRTYLVLPKYALAPVLLMNAIMAVGT